jgi:hypothetical protein
MLSVKALQGKSDFNIRGQCFYEYINERDPNVPFGCDHPSAEKHCYGLCLAQRGLGWHRDRYGYAASGSTLVSVLRENPYCSVRLRPGMTPQEWNYQAEFERKTCQRRMESVTDTGSLMIDHLRRGIFCENVPKRLYESGYNVRVLECPAIPEPEYGLIVISPDGFVTGRSGRALEIKIPVRVKEGFCGQSFYRVYWHCETDCRGYHYTEGCTPYELRHVCNRADPCPGCVEKNLTVYVHQTQGEIHVLESEGLDFVQLRANQFFTDVFGLFNGDDRGFDIKTMVEDFTRRPLDDLPLPKGKSPQDYLSVQYVPHNPGWYAKVHPKIEKFHTAVMDYRQKHGITFETYCEYNNLLERVS